MAAEPLPSPPEGLSPEDAAALSELVAERLAHQRAELHRATGDALAHLPALLRGPVGRLVGR